MTDFIHASKSYVEHKREGYVFVPTKPYKKNISVQRLYSHHKFAKDVAAKIKNMKIDLLHVMLPANSLTKVAREYKEMHPETKLCFDIIDLWPETMPINRFKNAYPFSKWKELRDANLGNADSIYCECYLFTQVLHKEDDKRFRTLYWVKQGEALESNPTLQEDELHLCYLGSINNVIDIDYIVNMCEALSQHRKVVIHIVGDGEKRQELIQKLQMTKAEVQYHGLVYDGKKKQEIFDQCHFGLNIMKSSVCVGLTMKSLDYFQAGLPIVNTIKGDTYEMVEEYNIGFNGYEALVDKLETLDMDAYMRMRENVKALYSAKFTKEAFEKSMME